MMAAAMMSSTMIISTTMAPFKVIIGTTSCGNG